MDPTHVGRTCRTLASLSLLRMLQHLFRHGFQRQSEKLCCRSLLTAKPNSMEFSSSANCVLLNLPKVTIDQTFRSHPFKAQLIQLSFLHYLSHCDFIEDRRPTSLACPCPNNPQSLQLAPPSSPKMDNDLPQSSQPSTFPSQLF